MKTFLVPIDFSPVSDDVVDATIELAGALKAKVVLLHVTLPALGGYDAVQAHLAAAALFEKAGIEHRTSIRQGDTAPAILDEAEAVGADFIVMGSHGHGKVYQLLVGSTTDGILRRTACAVILIPPEGRAYK